MRKKKAIVNMCAALLLQITTVLCGLIVPRAIIGQFGSSVNGLCASVSQFLGYIVLMESGIGGVVRAALYKPLAELDSEGISRIIITTEKFFRKIALLFVAYTVLLASVYPFIVQQDFDFGFTAPLVFIIGIGTFAQYYFGMTYQMLINADQRTYVTAGTQIITIVLNALLVVLLVKMNSSIYIVKLASASIFLLRPLSFLVYARKRYRINRSLQPDNKVISQRWNGLGQHIAYFLHRHTDVAVLTLFAGDLREVSVYTVYYMVVAGIEGIVRTISSGVEAAFGNMIAKREQKTLERTFEMYELSSFMVTTILFTAAAIMVTPFISIYTKGVTDAYYVRPLFGYILIMAEAVFCLRLPYQYIAYASGKYRETRNPAFVEAAINIVLSVALVFPLGIAGVAIGTLVAMLYRLISFAAYSSNHLLRRGLYKFIKNALVSSLCVTATYIAAHFLNLNGDTSYMHWAANALIITVIAAGITVGLHSIFNLSTMKNLVSVLLKNKGKDAGHLRKREANSFLPAAAQMKAKAPLKD
ncbi:MAG: lipopolysaccharide biosynthesis protein [Christensenellales bacterium]